MTPSTCGAQITSGPTGTPENPGRCLQLLILGLRIEEISCRLAGLEDPFYFLRQEGTMPYRNIIDLTKVVLLVIRVSPDTEPRG